MVGSSSKTEAMSVENGTETSLKMKKRGNLELLFVEPLRV